MGGIPSLGPYAASKAGIAALADVMRTELAHHGVGVGVTYFGWVDTDLVRRDAHPELGAIRTEAPRPLRSAIPVEQAVAAVVDAVEHRRSHVVAPRWIAPGLPLRGIVRPLLDRVARRYAPELEERWLRAAREHGVADASRPRGPSQDRDRRGGALHRIRPALVALYVANRLAIERGPRPAHHQGDDAGVVAALPCAIRWRRPERG